MNADQLLDLVSSGGALSFCLIAIWALATEKIVPRGRLDAVCKDRDERTAEMKLQRDEAIAGWRASVAAIEKLASTIEVHRTIRADILEGEPTR